MDGNTFISWSGSLSGDVALILRRWLRRAKIPAWTSKTDIPPGGVWFERISDRLSSSDFALLCVTRSNVNSPWMLWESGALYGHLAKRDRVIPLLIDLPAKGLPSPLSQFQAIDIRAKTKLLHVILDIAREAKSPLSDDQISDFVETHWGELRREIVKAIESSNPYPLTLDEQLEVFGSLDSVWLTVALFAVNTGLTVSELASLRWAWLKQVPELDAAAFVLPGPPGRVVVLNSIARRGLLYRQYKRPEDLLPRTKEPWRSKWIKQMGLSENLVFGGIPRFLKTFERKWGVAWARAGLPTAELTARGAENLRYTFEQRLFAAGVSWDDIDTLMGTNAKIDRYSQLNLKRLFEEAEKIVKRQDVTIIRRMGN